jgi:hypothetical protein
MPDWFSVNTTAGLAAKNCGVEAVTCPFSTTKLSDR